MNAKGIGTARRRRWYPTTVKNVLDRAVVEGVMEAALWFTGGICTGRSVMYVFGKQLNRIQDRATKTSGS